MVGMLVAGFIVLLAGLLTIGLGIPVKEFSFGNTLIAAGVLGTCTGVVLVALAFILRELKAISRALNRTPAGQLRDEPDPFASQTIALTHSDLPDSISTSSLPDTTASRHEQAAVGDRHSPGEAAAGESSSQLEHTVKRRKNLLFMSTRRDRMEASRTETNAAENETPASGVEPRGEFEEDSWSAPAWQRSDLPRRAARPSTDMDRNRPGGGTGGIPSARRQSFEAAPVTILKSGVVDGMAYSLYSDGSIEAQMPEGMVRFSSLEELRNYLDQRN